MRDWMSKYEKAKDEKREREIKEIIKQKTEEFEKKENNNEAIHLLEEIIELYNTLKLEAIEYNEKEYSRIQNKLQNIKYNKMKDAFEKTEEAKSWNEYKKEEEENER